MCLRPHCGFCRLFILYTYAAIVGALLCDLTKHSVLVRDLAMSLGTLGIASHLDWEFLFLERHFSLSLVCCCYPVWTEQQRCQYR